MSIRRTTYVVSAATVLVLSLGRPAAAQDCSFWEQVGSSGPPARHGLATSFDSARGVTVLYGGG